MEKTTTKTKTSLSDETRKNFENWVKGWDDRISTLDDSQRQEMTREKIRFAFTEINKFLNETDRTVMGKHKSEADAVKAMMENQNKPWYKKLKQISDFLSVFEFEVEKIFELKNRYASENIRLRAELAKCRNNQNG